MNCAVIQDLLILYADDCCGEESRALVEEHLKNCENCRKAYTEIRENAGIKPEAAKTPSTSFKRIQEWKASLLQSVLLFASFGLLTFGVAREAATADGETNGLWAIAVIIPVTAFLLSLANWYFVRLYPGKKTFSNCSLLVTVCFMAIGFLWAAIHYENALSNLFGGSPLSRLLLPLGCVLCLGLCLLSRLLSQSYANMLGKE